MSRGRKREPDAKREVISIRINEKQKEIINKNQFIKKEIDELVRRYVDNYM